MNKPSPFAGVKLSDQTPVPPSGLDQRLFSSSAQQPPTKSPTEQIPGNRERGKEGSKEGGKEASLPENRVGPPPFDLGNKPYRKDSFLFTSEEFEALEDLKLELRRKVDVHATKNDLARCAIQHLIEDYRRRGTQSIVVQKLTTKGRK